MKGNFKVWIEASRPKTLLAAAVPVIVGSAVAIYHSAFRADTALIALICSLLIQIATNFVNDLYDFLSGSDNSNRKGPKRASVSGLISTSLMKKAIYITFGTAFILGLYLVYTGGLLILLIGILSIMAGFAYTAGPFPLAYNGLGDIFVFVFFGLVATTGTYYVQAGEITPLAFWASVPVGALVTNILVVNNYRDIEEDRISNKRTLAVIFGKTFTQIQYIVFMLISYIIPVFVYISFKSDVYVFLPLLSLPLSVKLIKMIFSLEGSDLNKTLELTAKLSGLYAILFAAGILL